MAGFPSRTQRKADRQAWAALAKAAPRQRQNAEKQPAGRGRIGPDSDLLALAANEQARAETMRSFERDDRAAEADWAQTAVMPDNEAYVADEIDHAYSMAEVDANRAASHEDFAAALTARAYAMGTRQAVNHARQTKGRPAGLGTTSSTKDRGLDRSTGRMT